LIRGKDDLILTKQAIKKAILDLFDNDIRATKSGNSLVALFEIKFVSYRLHFTLAGKIPGLEMFDRKQSVFNYDNPDNFCFWGAYLAYKDFELAKQKKRWKATHDLACQYYNVDANARDMFIKNYKGFQLALEGEDFCNRERVNIRIFDYTGTSYVPGDQLLLMMSFLSLISVLGQLLILVQMILLLTWSLSKILMRLLDIYFVQNMEEVSI